MNRQFPIVRTKNVTRFDDLPPAQQAGMLCNDPEFQQFVGTRTIKSGVTLDRLGCEIFICDICKVVDRFQLDRSEQATTTFRNLRSEFDRWCNRSSFQKLQRRAV